MTQIQTHGKMGYGTSVKIKDVGDGTYNLVRGTVAGKVKGADLYLLLFDRSILRNNGFYRNLVNMTYGIPNRNLELEWGKYSGYWNEFIIPKEKLEIIVI